MFKFKKAMAGAQAQGDFECECCGSMENQNVSGCGCGSADNAEPAVSGNSCCGPVSNSSDKNGQQMPGCVPCGTPADYDKQVGNNNKSAGSGCGTSNNSCCG